MEEMEVFDDNKQRAKVAAGYKGGQYFTKPLVIPARHFEDAMSTESQVSEGFMDQASGNVIDAWVERRPNSSMKK